MRVGFIGLGSQGGPMARAIIDSGFDTTLWARRPASLEPYCDTAAKLAGSPAELGSVSDVVCLCVVGDADVEEVTGGDTGVLAGMADGGIIVVHSTVHPDTCRKVADAAAARGVSVIDAPVSGGGSAVAEKRLLVMVGGDPDVAQRCRPVFETYGTAIYLGELGSGQITKLLNNLLFAANLGSAKAALQLGQALGVNARSLADVITRGSGTSTALNSIAKSGGNLDVISRVAGPLLQKDVRLLVDVAEKSSATAGVVLDAADEALTLLGHPR